MDKPTRLCSLCGQEILSFHSYHSTGNYLVHIACEAGSRPSSTPRITLNLSSDIPWYNSDEKYMDAQERGRRLSE